MLRCVATALIGVVLGVWFALPAWVSRLDSEGVAKQQTEMLLRTCRSREHATPVVIAELAKREIQPSQVEDCPELVDVLVERGVFRERYATPIKERRVEVGMTLDEMIGAWGTPAPGSPPVDFDLNGVVTISDLLTVIANWGT